MATNYQMELQSWLKKLDLLQQENILLKNKIADIAKQDVNRMALERVEYYLNSFIEKDTVLALLRHEVAEEIRRVGRFGHTESAQMTSQRQTPLRNDIAKMEYEFYKLKGDFNTYIQQFTTAA
ncbi:MAG: hypothetical protein JST52_06860 [Bacteroidetes bacterium]|nr:hypothetical protein [Bacteroidota bacterium]MBS1776767.1 hypothetical protein [Bacteroidota bacterium]